MRRQSNPQGLAERWSAHPLDIDPYRLPARFALPVCEAAGRPKRDTVTITQDCVALKRDDAGAEQAWSMRDFAGVAIRMDRVPEDGQGVAISVNLHHDDPGLCIPVHIAFDMSDAGARWQSWGRALNLPLLMPTLDGDWRQAAGRPGEVVVRKPFARNPRQALTKRRSLFSAVRETGHWGPMPVRAGAEIVARA